MSSNFFMLFLGSMGPTELIILLVIVLVLFGANRVPQLMKGLGEGVKNFKTGMKDEDEKKLP